MPNRRIANSGYAAMKPENRTKSNSNEYVYYVNGEVMYSQEDVIAATNSCYYRIKNNFKKSSNFVLGEFKVSRIKL